MATLATQPALEELIISETIDPTQIAALELIDENQPSADIAAPSYNQIAVLAYAYWQERGCTEGTDQENWLRAEQELMASR